MKKKSAKLIVKRQKLELKLAFESKFVRENSMKILKEFEGIDFESNL
jgi:hypothetical protein